MSGQAAGSLLFRSTLGRCAALGLIVLLVGCAEMQQQRQQPGYYNPPPASSATDAIAHAEAPYGTQTMRAPNQIQIGLKGGDAAPSQMSAGGAAPNKVIPAGSPSGAVTGSGANTGATSAANASAADGLQASLFPEPLTFAGTLPCFHPEMKCSAQRITLTLAPNGRWRARAAYLEQANKSGAALADQGCWRVIPQAVPRIVLLNLSGNVRAELALTAANVLRLVSMNGDSPNLVYTLTRQPDLDPIDELNKAPPPTCP